MRLQKRLFLISIFSLLLFVFSFAQADDTQFRLVVSHNDVATTGEFHADLQIKITSGTTPRVLNSLTADVYYPEELSTYSSDPATSWFSADGYITSVSKDSFFQTSPADTSLFYRVLVTADTTAGATVGDPYAGFSVTGSWQNLVTLRWDIGSITDYDIYIDSPTDAAAYFEQLVSSIQDTVIDWNSDIKSGGDLKIASKVYLEGPYGSGVMSDSLSSYGWIPLTSPYVDQRQVAAIPADVVDWVFLQIRQDLNGPDVASKSVFLEKDGDLINDDGSQAEVTMKSISGTDNYYMIVRHKNHLAVMSSSAPALNTTSSAQYNFSSGQSQAYNSGGDPPMADLGSSVYGMRAGDSDRDNDTDMQDFVLWFGENGGAPGYTLTSDFNLDGASDMQDFIKWYGNNGQGSKVPNLK